MSSEQNNESVRGNIILGIFLVLFSLFVIIYSNVNFPSANTGSGSLTGPKFFPTVLGIFIFLCGIYEIIFAFIDKSFKKHMPQRSCSEYFKDWGIQNIIIFLTISFAYEPIIKFFGALIGHFLIVFILLYRLNVTFFKRITSSIILAVLIKILFETMFKIQLPGGILNILI